MSATEPLKEEIRSESDAESHILRYLAASLGSSAGPVLPDTPLVDSGLLDSLAILDLIEFSERRFGVKFRDEDLVPDQFATAGRLAALVWEKRAMKNSG